MSESSLRYGVVGFNHRTVPFELRQVISNSVSLESRVIAAMASLKESCEFCCLITCNRTEVILSSGGEAIGECLTTIRNAFYDLLHERHPGVYSLKDEDAVRHLFRVTSGLDSAALGETQITAQVKRAYAHGVELGQVSGGLHRLIQRAFRVSKRVRTETGVAQGRVSMASVAVNLLSQIFDSFEDKKALVIGAGETAELMIQHARALGIRDFVGVSRTYASALELMERYAGEALDMDDLNAFVVKNFADIDVIMIAINNDDSKTYFHSDSFKSLLASNPSHRLAVIDLSVPRAVDSEISKLDSVYLFDVGRLTSIAESNREEREVACEHAYDLIDQEVKDFSSVSQVNFQDLLRSYISEVDLLLEPPLERLIERVSVSPTLEDTESLLRNYRRMIQKRLLGTLTQLMKDDDVKMQEMLRSIKNKRN